MRSLNHNSTLKYAILFLFALVYGVLLFHNLRTQNFGWYNYTEWFVNYSGGFIRRGLPGQVLLILAQQGIITPFRAAFALGYFGILLVAALYLWQLIGNLRRLTVMSLITFLFLPPLLLFLLTIPGKKEIFGVLLVVLNLKCVGDRMTQLKKQFNVQQLTEVTELDWQTVERQYLIWIFSVFNLLAIPLLLSHESFFFLHLPINIAITYSFLLIRNPSLTALFKAILIYIPTHLTFLICFLGKGDFTTTAAICDAWQGLGLMDCDAQSGSWFIIGHSWASHLSLFNEHVIEQGSFLFYGISGVVNFCFLLGASASTLIDMTRISSVDSVRRRNYVSGFISKYFWLPFLVSTPLYLLGWDWGRWLSAILLCYAFCLLSPQLAQLEWLRVKREQRSRESAAILHLPLRLDHHWAKAMDRLAMLPQRCPRIYSLSLVYVVLFTSVPFFEMKSEHLYTGLIQRLISTFS
ncbi:MAG: hypothetical protein AAGG51_20810 [Cyanobacteria bacterium P01_G01_bin.54]